MQHLAEIERVPRKAGVDATVKRYEGPNHLDEPAETGAVAEYASLETTFDEAVLRDVVVWIGSTMGVE